MTISFPSLNAWAKTQAFTWRYRLKPRGVLVLMYHSISSPASDPLQLSVSPANLASQLKMIKRHFSVLSPDEFYNCYVGRRLPPDGVLLTFDDGYADNYIHALPILEQFKIPALFFIATAFVENRIQFPWVSGKPLSLTPSQLVRFVKSPFVTIGGHTHNHPRLGSLTQRRQLMEIEENYNVLSRSMPHPPRFFAYPFGQFTDYNRHSVSLVSRYYRMAFSAFCGVANHWYPKYELPRFVVRDWSGVELLVQIKSAFPYTYGQPNN